ncbi:MAG: cytochrome P450 [Streptosporangiaceae bacterium]
MTGAMPAHDGDPFSHDVLDDPRQLQHELREAGPVVYLTRYDVYALARYEHVHAALVDWQSFQSGAGVGLANLRRTPTHRAGVLLEADPPRHDAPRRVQGRTLSVRALRPYRDVWRAKAEELVDEVLAEGPEFDAYTRLARAFPLRVFPDAVGIPAEGRENLVPFGDANFNSFGPRNDLVQRDEHRLPGLTYWVMAQTGRDVLSDSGFGAAIYAASDRHDIPAERAPFLVRSLLAAGVDTTISGLSAVLYALASYPAQWERLRDNPALIRVAFDEAVRWESPVQTFFRTASRDVPIGGHVIPEGEKILMFLGAANRDPRRWDDPDAFDLDRDPSGHVGFGMGIHQCVGQHVARLEAESVLQVLVKRVRGLELTGPVVRHHNNTLRAWESIPLRVRPV